MKFYNEIKPLYIVTDVSGVGLVAALLQTRDNMSCHRHEAPESNILRLIVFASKSLIGVKKRYSNIERKALGILLAPSLLLCQGGKYNHRPQTAHCHIQERCSHIVTKTQANTINP